MKVKFKLLPANTRKEYRVWTLNERELWWDPMRYFRTLLKGEVFFK